MSSRARVLSLMIDNHERPLVATYDQEGLLLTAEPNEPNEPPLIPFFTPEEVHEADFDAKILRQNNVIVLPENATEGQIIELLSRNIPANEYGLPIYYIRSDLLPPLNFTNGILKQEDADAAAEDILYTEGFPTLSDGRTFWNQLPHEPRPSFDLFKRWLDLGEIEGIRIYEDLSIREHIPLAQVTDTAKQYYWTSRARAYDLFVVAAEQKKREHRIRRAENKHYNTTEVLLAPILAKFEDDPEWTDKLSPTEALEALSTLIKLQRQSLGLGSNGNTGTNNPNKMPEGSSAELIFRQIAQQAAPGEPASETLNMLQEFLQDPKAGMQAQELILRVNRPGTGA